MTPSLQRRTVHARTGFHGVISFVLAPHLSENQFHVGAGMLGDRDSRRPTLLWLGMAAAVFLYSGHRDDLEDRRHFREGVRVAMTRIECSEAFNGSG